MIDFKYQAINVLIKDYRERKAKIEKDNNFLQKNFIYNYDEHGNIIDEICSLRTFTKIETNKGVCKEEIYSKIVNKLGFKYGHFPEIDCRIDEIADNVKHLLNNAATKDLDAYCEVVKEIFAPAEGYFYYQDLGKALIDILCSRHLDSIEINDNWVSRYSRVIKLLDRDHFEMVCAVICYCTFKGQISPKVSAVYQKKLESMDSRSVHSLMIRAVTYNSQGCVIEAIKMCIEGLKQCEVENNIYYTFRFYTCLGIISQTIDFGNLGTQYLLKARDIVVNNRDFFSNEELFSMYINLATYNFVRCNYTETLNAYREANNLMKWEVLPTGFHPFLVALVKTGNIEELKSVIKIALDHKDNYPEESLKLMVYYKMKFIDESSDEELMEYIMSEKSSFGRHNIFTYHILNDLKSYALSTKRYKPFVDFYENPVVI